MSIKYLLPVEIEIDENGIYIVYCQKFKGCHADGSTINNALNALSEVVELCMDEE